MSNDSHNSEWRSADAWRGHSLCEQHTSHVTLLVESQWRTWLKAQVWRAQRTFHVSACIIFMHPCCVFDSPWLSVPLLAVHLLSYRLVHLPDLQLLLPRCGGQIPCALSLMRTLAPLPSTTLSQGMSPTTCTSQRPQNCTSRNPPARTGPWTRMTLSTMTTPSAWRSLHHCSPRS